MKNPIRWTADEVQAIAQRALEIHVEQPITHTLTLFKYAQEVLPSERRREITSHTTYPPLTELYQQLIREFFERPVEVIQTVKYVPAPTPAIESFSTAEMMRELGRRHEVDATTIKNQRTDIDNLLEADSKAKVILISSPPPAPVQEIRVINIGLVAFLPGQVDALRRMTMHHASRYHFVVRQTQGKNKMQAFGSSIDAVICMNNFRGHHSAKIFEDLKGIVPLGRATGLGDAARMVANLCCGYDIDKS